MSDNAGQIASQLASYAGQFAFMFPTPQGMAIGGALTFVSSMISVMAGAAADRPDVGPSAQDLENDIQRLGAVLSRKIDNLSLEKRLASLRGAAEAERSERILFDQIRHDHAKYLLQEGSNKPGVLNSAMDLDRQLMGGGGPDLRDACHDIEVLQDEGEKMGALLTYCSARTRLHSMIKNNLLFYQAVYAYNNQHGSKTDYPDDKVPLRWSDAPILMTPLQSSLQDAVGFAEPLLKKLKTSYQTRLTRARAEAAKAKVPAQKLKTELDRINSDEHLNRISEAAVDQLLGTATRMGVVDLWKEALETCCGVSYQGAPFVRGDKVDPPRLLPTVWLNPNDTRQISGIAENGEPQTLNVLAGKIATQLGSNDRPFIGPVRNAPEDRLLLTVVVVNTTDTPLLLAEPLAQLHGGMVSKCVVAKYPFMNAKNRRGTANFSTISNADSADAESWVDAAPLKAMDPNTAAVGVWQFVAVPSDDRIAMALGFKSAQTAGAKTFHVGAATTSKPNAANVCAVEVAGKGTTLASFAKRVASKLGTAAGSPKSTSGHCVGSVWPATGASAQQDVVVTVMIRGRMETT